ncbi:MAG TPA: class I SAM-dependent methyltransferase [Steroidobacteraceae bacterium]|nr:class I SAM-dependent methyltransferase [Steroidobacteraceae bacterium]
MATENTMQHPPGAVLHSPMLYDAIVWLAMGGRERRLRRRLLDLSGLRPGESVIDVGCGTGTLAILAKKNTGEAGKVFGVDASPEMLARARSKAVRAGIDVSFELAAAQALPFADFSFDLALSTMMLHHLGRVARRELAAELRRVIRPGGRALVVDFARHAGKSGGWRAHFRHRHGHVDPAEIVALLEGAGFRPVASGAVGIMNMHFALAAAPETQVASSR